MRVSSRSRRRAAVALAPAAALVAAGCGGMLDPQGPRAERVALMWWVMLAVSVVAMAIVVGVLADGLRRARRADAPERAGERTLDRWFVFGGGVAFPVTVMIVLMVLTVLTGREITRAAPEGHVTIEVVGHQWWWEVRYPDHGFTTANEIHVPVDEAVLIRLRSADVIHSFWVPNLSGKIDLVPGQTNTLVVEASNPGTYRGQCAEFCGLQHAGMRVHVIAQPRAEFDEWLSGQAEPATALTPEDGDLFRGQQAFLGSACVYCHTIRGTNASGTLGPDLTHLATRQTLAAGLLPNTRGHLAGWILDPQSVKPGTQMPSVQLAADQLEALLSYLGSLR